MLQHCFSNGLRILNSFFQHRDVYKDTWYRPSMNQKSLIDFCLVSSDFFSDVLEVRVKRGAEFSTDHHLVVCSLRLSKPWPNRKSNRSLATKGFGGQRSKETVFIQYIILSSDNFLMYPRTLRRNGCCSDQRSFHQMLKVVGDNGLKWQAIVRKKHLDGTKRLKKQFEQRNLEAF